MPALARSNKYKTRNCELRHTLTAETPAESTARRRPPQRLALPSERIAYSPVLLDTAGFEACTPHV